MSIAKHYKCSRSQYNESWQEFVENVKEHEFEIGFHNGQKGGFEEAIFFNTKKGIVIYAFTYSGMHANHAVAYGEIKTPEKGTEKARMMSFFKHFQMKNGILAFSIDAKEGLEELLKRKTEFCTPWKIGQEMQLMNFDERQRLNPNEQKARTEEKLMECPYELRRIVGTKK